MKRLVLLLFIFSGCALVDGTDKATVLEKSALLQHWVHSFEEDPIDGIMLFRPERGRDFPPSRFRRQYVFSDDGTCQWYYLAPNDAHYFREGRWMFDPEKPDILRIEVGEMTVTYRILVLRQDELRVELLF